MSNLKAKIDGHNKKILENTPPPKKIMQLFEKRKLLNERRIAATLKIFYTTLE